MRGVLAFVLPIYRMPRWQFWIAALISLAVAALSGSALVSMHKIGDPQSKLVVVIRALALSPVSAIGLYAGALYVYVVASINRLHDIEKSGWNVLWLFLPYLAIAAFMFATAMHWVDGNAVMPMAKPALGILYVVSCIAALILFVPCAFFRGDEWANRYGPAPCES